MFKKKRKSLRQSPVNNYISQHIKAIFTSFRRLSLAPVATLMTCAIIGIVLTLPMGLFIFLKNVQPVSHNLHNSAQISLYLKMNVSQKNIDQLLSTLQSNHDIQHVHYISPAEGLKEFQQQSGFGDILAELQNNPLPGVMIVQPKASVRTMAAANALLDQLKQLPSVDTAQLDMDWLNRLNAILVLGHHIAYAIVAIFFLAVLLIISHTIRSMTQNFQDEIRITKLLGGTNRFICRPFLYSGMIYGLVGGMMAWGIIYAVMWFLQEPITQVTSLYGTAFNISGLDLKLTLMLLGSGMLLGYVGSWLSVAHHIDSVETR